MEILRFLKIIERIIIFIVIGGFAPLTVYVFKASPLRIPAETQVAYSKLKDQIKSGFVLDVRKNCTLEQGISFNFYCFDHCKIGSTCSVVSATENCTIGKSQFTRYGKRYCASRTIKNTLQTTDPYIQLKQSNMTNSTLLPLFGIQNATNVTYYVFNGDFQVNLDGQTCRDIVERLGDNLQLRQRVETGGYLTSLLYIFYTLVPICTFAFLSTIIEVFTRFQCKRLMQISLFNASIISLAIIVIGIIFDIKSREFQNTIKWLGTFCLINSPYAETYFKALTVDLSNGLSTGFSIGIGIVGGVEIFMIICLIIVWFIELKMHKLKKEDFSSSYELQTL